MEDFDLIDVLRKFRSQIVGELHTTMPGKILKYDPTTQLADVQPMVKRVFYDPDTLEKSYENFPAIPRVPVQFPGGNGFTVTFPLAAGDTVDLHFNEACIAEYLETGQMSEPQDVRRHSLSYPIAYPVYVPCPRPNSDVAVHSNDAMVIGQEGGIQIQIDGANIILGRNAFDYAALASKVDAAVAAIVAGFNAHVHVSAAAGSPTAVPTTPLSAQPSVAATVTKVE